MVKPIVLSALALATAACVPAARTPAPAVATASASPQAVCKQVVSADPGSKPFEQCLTRAEWAEREAIDGRDANRIECRYQEVPGDRFRSKKICQPASAWVEHRRLEREEVERIQRATCVRGGGC